MKVDLGCGQYKKEGYVGVDQFHFDEVDVVCNMEIQDLPFEANSIEEVNATMVLEHIWNLIHVMNEVYRVLIPGGKFYIEVPLFPEAIAIKDPTHCRFFILESFDHFDLEWNYQRKPEFGIKKWHVTKEIRHVVQDDGYEYRSIVAVLVKPDM